jgi:surfeit locus 1 family protein
MPAGYSFRPRLWAWLLVAAGCAAFISLGQWQTRRAEEKRARGNLERVSVSGSFAPKFTVLLDNKVRHERAGYEVVTPLKLSGAEAYVLVDRGWVAAPPRRELLPDIRTPAGEVRIEGLALARLPRALQLKEEGTRRRQNLDVQAYAAETGLRLESRVIEQHSALDDGLERDWPPHDAGAAQSESYALQWYSFAALALILGVVFSFRRG